MRFIHLALAAMLATGCMSASQHAAEVAAAQEAGDRLSVGTVQREIREGMTSAEVVEILGAPNMVTTDSQRRESWVYDRISTNRVHSDSSGSLLIAGWGKIGGLLGGAEQDAGASSTSQRTLTIIIKFDEKGLVRDFAYRSSSF